VLSAENLKTTLKVFSTKNNGKPDPVWPGPQVNFGPTRYELHVSPLTTSLGPVSRLDSQ